MLGLFKKRAKMSDPKAPNLYAYHTGLQYHADAQEMVFHSALSNPVIVFRGAGRLAGSLRVTQLPMVRFNRQTIITGMPRMMGQLSLHPLVGGEG